MASSIRTASAATKRVELEGIFVQIGLLPNTDWLKGTLKLSPRGEIEIDARGQTSLPGVFAAGDATTTPYKQIIIAMGEGAKASLSAFDHLIRSPAPAAATLLIWVSPPDPQRSSFTFTEFQSTRRNIMKANKSVKVAKLDIGISDKDRAAIAQGLSGLLADSYTLYLMTHNFHWNVTGPMFNTLHLMFMGQYTEQWNALDLIAERIRALGHPAPGTYKEFVKLATIKEVEGQPKALDMVRHLVAAQEATARTARKLFPLVDKANDQPTADLLTQRIEVHEKTAWMLRSLLEETSRNRSRGLSVKADLRRLQVKPRSGGRN
jgi:starvation-inducible DNA-binding protein